MQKRFECAKDGSRSGPATGATPSACVRSSTEGIRRTWMWAQHKFMIQAIKGSYNVGVDFLSRCLPMDG